MIRQTALPFKLERTDEALSAHGGLALLAEYTHALGLRALARGQGGGEVCLGSGDAGPERLREQLRPTATLALRHPSQSRVRNTAAIGTQRHLSTAYRCFWGRHTP